MAVNYNDKRFTQVEREKDAALRRVDDTYGGMIDSAESYYQKQVDAANQWGDKQAELQQEQTDFTIAQINQDKAQAEKDYQKEQSAAYVDYQRQTNQFGAKAEEMAAGGLQNDGYSESSRVSMYNAYQNRVTTARESFNQVVMNYNNGITQARLQNSSALAQIHYQTLQAGLTLALEGFQYKNSLVMAMADKKTEVENMYHTRWQDVLSQINTENALAENQRQFNAQMAEEKRQYNSTLALQREQFAWQKAQAAKSASGGSSGGSSRRRSSGSSSSKKKSSKSSGSATIKKTSGSSTVKKKSSSPKVDMQSVLGLGYGPISASRLNDLVSSGKVVEYEKNGKLKYKKVFNG